MQTTVTVHQLLRAIADLSAIFLDERSAGYLQPQRGPILTAVNMEDHEALSATVTRAIQFALAAAGFKGHLTPDLLRAITSDPNVGVRAIHDAIDKRENAMTHLSAFVDQAGRGAFSGAQRGPATQPRTALVPQRGHQPASQGGAAPQRTTAPPAGGRSVPAPNRDPSPQDRASEFDDNPFPVGRSSTQSGGRPDRDHHNDAARGGSDDSRRAPAQSHGQSNVSNLHDQRTSRGSYAERRQSEATPAASEADIQNRQREQKNVYGSKASIQFSAGMTKPKDKRPARPTVYMEAARILNAQNRTYDWNNKIILQMTAHELQVVTALLFGLIPSCKFANHGHPGEDAKWFEFAHQEGQYAGTIKIACGKASDVLVCSMGAEDIGDVTAMFLRQCAEQMRIEQAAVPATLRVVAQAYNARNAAKGGNRAQGAQGAQGAQSGGGQSAAQRRYG